MSASELVTDVLRYKQVAQEFNIPINTLYSKVSRREIPHYRLSGRCVLFSRAQLKKYFESHQVSPSSDDLADRSGVRR